MAVSKLVWHRNDVPEELCGMLETLGGEYPISEGGRGLRLRFRKVAGEGILSRVIRSKGEVLVEYNKVAGAARGYCYTAMEFLPGGELLLAYCCGRHLDGDSNLQDLKIRKINVNELWKD